MQVEYIDHMGSDLSVVNAARVSFAKEKQEMDDSDERLIKYLYKHNHWTPFAHTCVSLRMKAPVPIRTQCFKHKQGLVENEESRRYISSTPEFFMPESLRMKPEGSIKQGSAGDHPESDIFLAHLKEHYAESLLFYNRLIGNGISPEQARLVLPQGAMVNWIWTGNVYAFANFYKKRIDPDAQKEIQVLAQMVSDVIQPLFPVTWNAILNND